MSSAIGLDFNEKVRRRKAIETELLDHTLEATRFLSAAFQDYEAKNKFVPGCLEF
jgi:hypothetical protein